MLYSCRRALLNTSLNRDDSVRYPFFISTFKLFVFIFQATHSLSELRWLSLSGNPITALMNTSLYGVSPRLEYLDVTRLRLRILEVI